MQVCVYVHACTVAYLGIEKWGCLRSKPRARSVRVRTIVRQCGGSGGPPPGFFFTLHALRLILMQSWQRNVDEIKYTIANITMNIMPIKSSSKNVTKFHTASMASGDLNTLVNQGICTVDLHVG